MNWLFTIVITSLVDHRPWWWSILTSVFLFTCNSTNSWLKKKKWFHTCCCEIDRLLLVKRSGVMSMSKKCGHLSCKKLGYRNLPVARSGSCQSVFTKIGLKMKVIIFCVISALQGNLEDWILHPVFNKPKLVGICLSTALLHIPFSPFF